MPAPVITTQPSSKISAKDKEVTLTVVATGAVSYQWYTRTFNDVEFGTPNNIPNTNSSTLKITYNSTIHTLNRPLIYGVKVTNADGSTETDDTSRERTDVTFIPISGLTLDVNSNNDRILSWTADATSDYRFEISGGAGVARTIDISGPLNSITFTAEELLNRTTITLTVIAKSTEIMSAPLIISDTVAASGYNLNFELIEGKDFIIIPKVIPEKFIDNNINYVPKFVVSVGDNSATSHTSRAIELQNLGNTGVAKTITVKVYSIFNTKTVTKTSTDKNYTNANVEILPVPANTLIDYLSIVQPTATTVLPLAVQQSLLSDPLTEVQLTALGTNHPTGIKVGETMVLFPKNNESIITSAAGPFRFTNIKIRIPANGPWSPIKILNDGTTVQYKGIVNGVKQFIASGPTVESTPKTLKDGETFRVTINGGFRLVTVSFGSINLNIGNAPVDNSFPARVNPYIALSNVLIYTKATVDALVAGTPLPAVPRVAWALSGVNAGSVMRDLHRIVVVADDAGRHLQRWARVQYVNGSASEGVDDTLADYGCGWICVWDASGIAPVY